MKSIKVIIIDDEPIAIEVIKELVNHLAPDLLVEGTATNGVDAIEKIKTLHPDLVFMDVDMPLMNGVEVLKKFPFRTFHLVFTTGFGSAGLKNIRHEAVDCLLKPIDPDEFMAAVERVRLRLAAGDKAAP